MQSDSPASQVVRPNPREAAFRDFAAVRSDINWREVSHFPGMHEGRVILVTGGAQGLGREIAWWASVFGGGKVILCDVKEDHGRFVEEEFRRQITRAYSAGEVYFRKLDVTDPHACATLVKEVIGEHGKLDVLVSNAGIGAVDTLTATIDDAKRALCRKVIDVNFFGFTNIAAPFVEHVKQGRAEGRIDSNERKKLIAVCSIGGIIGLLDRYSYGASKFALAGAINSTIIDHGDIVEVLGVNPGRMATDMPLQRIAEAPEGIEREVRRWIMASTQRNGEMVDPREVGQHISWLASTCPSTKPLRNTMVNMDDGWTAGHQPRIDQAPIEVLEGLLAQRRAALPPQ